MRGEDARQHEGSNRIAIQEIAYGEESNDKRHKECEQSELQTLGRIPGYTTHVQFQSGQEHDVVDTNLSEQLKRTVAFEQVQSILSYQHTSQNEAYDVWNMQLAEQKRGTEDDDQNEEEYPGRVGDQSFAMEGLYEGKMCQIRILL